MNDFAMTINGAPARSSSAISVVNPATGAVFAQAPDCDRTQLDEAMQGARRAFDGWKDDLDRRRAVMRDCATAIEKAAGELGELATMEQGMPIAMALGSVHRAAQSFRRCADLELPRVTIQDDEVALVEAVRRPIGVIAAIKPWNIPIGMAVGTVAPAFRAGCTVVLKPSPYTPLVTLKLGEVLRGVVPPGVLNVVSGADPLGQWMTGHPVPRGISFTGSVATGKKVNVAAARDLKRVLLELGGNDPAIVLDDVEPADLVEKMFWRAFTNAGQICMAIKRVYVPERLYQPVVDALAAKARGVRVGNGLDPSTQMGPVNNLPQYERVQELVAEAVAGGATVATGGRPIASDGYFFEPTILADLPDDARVVAEEQFGPALPVLPYRTLDEAIARANATTYGLGASVWSADPARAAEVAERVEAGTVWINTHGALGPGQPFQGVKWSGLGSGNGIWSVYAFTDVQTVYRARSGPDVYGEPTGARAGRAAGGAA